MLLTSTSPCAGSAASARQRRVAPASRILAFPARAALGSGHWVLDADKSEIISPAPARNALDRSLIEIRFRPSTFCRLEQKQATHARWLPEVLGVCEEFVCCVC